MRSLHSGQNSSVSTLYRPPGSPSQLTPPQLLLLASLIESGLAHVQLSSQPKTEGRPHRDCWSCSFLWIPAASGFLNSSDLFPLSSIPLSVWDVLLCATVCRARQRPGMSIERALSFLLLRGCSPVLSVAQCWKHLHQIFYLVFTITYLRGKVQTCNFIRVIIRLQCFQPFTGTFKNWEISH